MTDAATPPAADSPRAASARLDDSDAPWPLRPWIMAALCAAAGLLFHLLIDHQYPDRLADWRSALATAVAVATIVFVLGVEQRRWHWALGFAALWGVIMGLIAWQTAGYNLQGTPVEWPFWSGMLAVLVATPLFQTRRDVAPDWRFWKLWQMPYARLHSHAWADAVLGAASLAFVFGWMLAGAAFGGAVGVLRERDRLVSTLQRLVMIVLALLAPVLAAALILFLLALLGTGLQKLWDAGFSTAGLMLGVSAFAVLLANAVIGNGAEDRSANRILVAAAAVLAAAVLPLAIIAAVSMGLRIGQYGWTPERIWGVIAVGVALAYGLAGVWSLARQQWAFDDALRPLQQKLAIALMLLAAFLALPILDFGAISARDQLARLQSGAVTAEKFDWAAMAFDFGPAGRAALKDLAKSPQAARADKAKAALQAKNRWDLTGPNGPVLLAPFAERLRVHPAGRALPPEAAKDIEESYVCARAAACVAFWVGDERIAVLGQDEPGASIDSYILVRREPGGWQPERGARPASQGRDGVDLAKAKVAVETVERRQVTVDGAPETPPFE